MDTNSSLKNLLDVITVLIALYGAILSTYVFYKSRITVTVDILKDMKSVNTWTVLDYIKVTNKNKEPIYVQSIWIRRFWAKKYQWYFLTIDNDKMKIDGLRSQIYQSERWFSLDELMTISVYTDHGELYLKHYKNIFFRTYDWISSRFKK
jgi:hypothetical protein